MKWFEKGLVKMTRIVCGILFLISIHSGFTVRASLKITSVLTEGRENPLGINTLSPHFSWQLVSEETDVLQKAFRIQVSRSKSFDVQADLVWDSQWIQSEQSLYNIYQGEPLDAGTTYSVRIQVRDNQGEHAVSDPCIFHTGLL